MSGYDYQRVTNILFILGLDNSPQVVGTLNLLISESLKNPEAKKVLTYFEGGKPGEEFTAVGNAFMAIYQENDEIPDGEIFIRVLLAHAATENHNATKNPIVGLKEKEIPLPDRDRETKRLQPMSLSAITPEEENTSWMIAELIKLCELDTDNQDSIEKLRCLIKESKTNEHAASVLIYLGSREKSEPHTQAAIRFFNRYEIGEPITDPSSYLPPSNKYTLTVMTTPVIEQASLEMMVDMSRIHALADNAVFIDCESCSLEHNAAVMSVAAVPFYINSPLSVIRNLKDKNHWYKNLDLTEQYFKGCFFDPKTQSEFWGKPELEQARQLLLVNQEPVKESLKSLMDFIKPIIKDGGFVFFRNPKADWMWIDNLCKLFGVKNLIKYNRAHNLSTWLSARLGYECVFYNIPEAHQQAIDHSLPEHHSLYDSARDAFQITTVNRDTGFEVRSKP